MMLFQRIEWAILRSGSLNTSWQCTVWRAEEIHRRCKSLKRQRMITNDQSHHLMQGVLMKTNAITLAFFLLVLCGGLMAQESQLQEETPTESAEEPAAEAQETTVQDAALEDSAVEDVSSNLEQPQPVAPADPQAADGSTEESRSVRRLGDMVGSGSSEFSMDIPTINAPAIDPATLPEVSLPNAQQDDVLQSLLRRQAFSPNDPEIATEMTALMNQVEADAQA